MKRRALALVLGLILVMTAIPALAVETDAEIPVADFIALEQTEVGEVEKSAVEPIEGQEEEAAENEDSADATSEDAEDVLVDSVVIPEKPEEPADPEEIPEMPEEPADSEEPVEEIPDETEKQTRVSLYERDADGNLILDADGNPIPILLANASMRPVAWLRDASGALVLDEYGEPIPTQFVPIDSQMIGSLADAIDPNCRIDIYADFGEGDDIDGLEVTLIAVFYGYDNLVYDIQWQTSQDNVEWTDIEGATESSCAVVMTEENFMNYWRVKATITDAIA